MRTVARARVGGWNGTWALAGATLAAAVGMAIGALIGFGTAELSDRLA